MQKNRIIKGILFFSIINLCPFMNNVELAKERKDYKEYSKIIKQDFLITQLEEVINNTQEQFQEKEDIYNIDFTLTHYGTSEKENGGYEGITCTGKKLKEGMAASNYYKLGTIIEFENGKRVIIADKGGKDFNSPNRLDIYVETYSNEVLNQLGKKHLKGRIINE